MLAFSRDKCFYKANLLEKINRYKDQLEIPIAKRDLNEPSVFSFVSCSYVLYGKLDNSICFSEPLIYIVLLNFRNRNDMPKLSINSGRNRKA